MEGEIQTPFWRKKNLSVTQFSVMILHSSCSVPFPFLLFTMFNVSSQNFSSKRLCYEIWHVKGVKKKNENQQPKLLTLSKCCNMRTTTKWVSWGTQEDFRFHRKNWERLSTVYSEKCSSYKFLEGVRILSINQRTKVIKTGVAD